MVRCHNQAFGGLKILSGMLETFYILDEQNETVTLCLASSRSGHFLGWWHGVKTGLVTEKARRHLLKSGAKPRTGSVGAHSAFGKWKQEVIRSRQGNLGTRRHFHSAFKVETRRKAEKEGVGICLFL